MKNERNLEKMVLEAEAKDNREIEIYGLESGRRYHFRPKGYTISTPKLGTGDYDVTDTNAWGGSVLSRHPEFKVGHIKDWIESGHYVISYLDDENYENRGLTGHFKCGHCLEKVPNAEFGKYDGFNAVCKGCVESIMIELSQEETYGK